MQTRVVQLLQNYQPNTGLTWVNLPSTFALHKCMEALIFFGYLTPVSADWNYSYGEIKFKMSRKKFQELKSISLMSLTRFGAFLDDLILASVR